MIPRAPRALAARPLAAILLTAPLALFAATGALAQEGPRPLFPDAADPSAPPAAVEAPTEAQPVPRRRPAEVPAPVLDPSPVRVADLEAPGLDAIGLDDGLGLGLWRDQPVEATARLVETLPAPLALPPVRELARRLLVTGAATEAGGEHEGMLLEARIERLQALGLVEEAAALLAQVPLADAGETILQLRADVGLLSGAVDDACLAGEAARARFEDLYWDRLAVICRLDEGDRAGAQLGFSLLRELGDQDDAFHQLIDLALAADGTPPPGAWTVRSPLHLALIREAGAPAAVDPDAGSAVLAAIARLPAGAPEARLAAAERAALLGALPASELAGLYAALKLDDSALEESAPDAIQRAQLLRAVDEAESADERARAMVSLWRAHPEGPLRLLVAELAGGDAVALAPEPALAAFAPELARILLATGRIAQARRWQALLDGTEDPAQAVARDALRPLVALADAQASPPDAGPMLRAWSQARGTALAPLLYALHDGLGMAVPAALWRELMVTPETAEWNEPPPAALWMGVERAAAEGRLGLTVLAALRLLGETPEAAHPAAIARSLEALRSLGLEPEARRIAVTLATAAGA